MLQFNDDHGAVVEFFVQPWFQIVKHFHCGTVYFTS